jgi:large subunit ribosomal protein L25
MESKSLTIEPRTQRGKNENRRLRNQGFIPAVLYSHGESEAIMVPRKDFIRLFKGRISESVIFDLHSTTKKDDIEKMAYVKDYHMDPITGDILHLDLYKVTKGEKIHTHVPIEFIGTAKGTKLGGILEIDIREVIVECMPKDLPEKIQIDVTNMVTGDSIHVKDIVLAEGVKILTNPEQALASVHVPKVTAEEEKVEEVAAAGEAGEAQKDTSSEG